MAAKRITALVMILLLGSTAEGRVLPGGAPTRAIFTVAMRLALTTLSSLTVTAGTIGATNPQANPSPGANVQVDWTQKQANNSTWTLSVRVPAQTNFTSCGTAPIVPVTAVQVTCNSVTSGAGGGWGGSCSATNVTLTPGANIVLATGNSGSTNQQRNVTAILTYTFTDDFKYAAVNSCTVSLQYTVTG
jgi:hypothetical protein